MKRKLQWSILVICLISICLITSANFAWALDVEWNDYKETMEPFQIWDTEDTDVTVDLPAKYLKGKDTVTLKIFVGSGIRDVEEMEKGGSFYGLLPKIIINDSVWAVYKVPVTKYPDFQRFDIILNTKDFRPGKNKLTFTLENILGVECLSDGCPISVISLHFAEFPDNSARLYSTKTKPRNYGTKHEKPKKKKEYAEWYYEYGFDTYEELFSPAAVPKLIEILQTAPDITKVMAINALAEIGLDAKAALPALKKLTRHSMPIVNNAARKAVEDIENE